MNNTRKLGWYGTEDGYVIVGTTDHMQANEVHDQLVTEHLAGMDDLDDYKAASLDTPTLFYIRPDYLSSAVDEDTPLDIDPVTGEKLTATTGLPALHYS